MPRMKLNRSNIDRDAPLTARGTVDYWDYGDGSVKGFGLRAGMQTKTFIVQVDVPVTGTGRGTRYKSVRKAIGRYGEWTPEQARKRAVELIRELKERKNEQAGSGSEVTLAAMVETYLQAKKLSPGTEIIYRRQLPVRFPGWMPMKLKDVAQLPPEVIVGRLNQIIEQTGEMAAYTAFAKLQAVLNFAMVLYPAIVPRNPCAVISQAKLWPKQKTRTDCLRGSEFKRFYDGIQAYNAVTRDALLFCLYQGCRNRETSGLRWEHVDLAAAILRVPATKNSEPLHVPLSSQSLEILKRRLAANPEGCPYVFSTMKDYLNKTGHITLTSQSLRDRTGLAITIHGLRRSFVDIADNKLKLRREDVDRLVNHVDRSVTGRHYSHKDVEDLRDDLRKVCNEIERLMLHGVGASVTQLATAKPAKVDV